MTSARLKKEMKNTAESAWRFLSVLCWIVDSELSTSYSVFSYYKVMLKERLHVVVYVSRARSYEDHNSDLAEENHCGNQTYL